MKILVTGGAGFIGSNLVRMLLQQTDHEVVNLDALTYAGNLESLGDVDSLPRYQFVHGNICDTETVLATFARVDPDAVIHLAAESHVDRSIDGPAEFVQTNVIGTFNLLQASLDHFLQLSGSSKEQFRFIHVSTDEVFGSLGAEDPPFTETTRYDPRSPYSASKAAADHFVQAWFETYGLPVLITNCSNNYGPFQFPEKLIPVVILKCLAGDPIPVYGTGEQIRDWIFVDDHCRGLIDVLDRGRPGETYNIGGDDERTNMDIVRMLCRILDELRPNPDIGNYEKLIQLVEDRPGHDQRYAIDASKMKSEIGWRPQEELESGLRKTVQWYLENESWWKRILSGDYRLDRLGRN